MTPRRSAILALVILAAMAPNGQGRQVAGPAPLEPPLDEAVADRNVLSRSLRLVDPGLSLPDDFDNVYRVPGYPDQLMRVQGSVYAVFPYSVYKRDKKGRRYADIPAGTVFHIGGPPDPVPELPSPALFADRLATQLPPQAAGRVRYSVEPLSAEPSALAPTAQTPESTLGAARSGAIAAIERSAAADESAAAYRSERAAGGRYGALATDERSAAADESAAAYQSECAAGGRYGALETARPVTLPAIVADAEYRARRLREMADLADAVRRGAPQAALGRSSSSSK